jgi:hypothetical protein
MEAFFSGSGACGMYSLFTCRLLTEMGYDCRVVQQQVQGTWGGHITLEVDLNRFNDAMPAKWMLIDPLFNHVFLDSQGLELSALQVKAQWPMMVAKLPLPNTTPNTTTNKDFDTPTGTNWVLCRARPTLLVN